MAARGNKSESAKTASARGSEPVAVILAAGEGMRLRPFTRSLPKPMIPVANRPILEYVVEAVRSSGIKEMTIVVGYKKEKIKSHFGNGSAFGVSINYAEQKKQMGALHAFSCAGKIERPVLVLAGDHMVKGADLRQLLKAGTDSALVTSSTIPSKYGTVEVRGKKLVRLDTSGQNISRGNALISTGIYYFSPATASKLSSLVKDGTYKLGQGINQLLESGKNIKVVRASTWADVVYPWNLINMNSIALRSLEQKLSGMVEPGVDASGSSVGEGSILRRGTVLLGHNSVGEGSSLGPYAVMEDSSIGDNVTIGAFTVIRNSVIMDDVQIGDGCIIENTVIGEGCSVGPGVKVNRSNGYFFTDREHHFVEDAGAVIGPDCSVGANTVLTEGTILGAGCKVGAGLNVRGSHPDGSILE